jgi:hypothetical protein
VAAIVDAAASGASRCSSASTAGRKRSKVCSIGSPRRRERRNHVVARAVSQPSSISIADCTASGTRLSSASICCHSATSPITSRVAR